MKKQIRYVKDGDERNYPLGLTAQQLVSGSFLKDSIRITNLSIYGIYGLKFYLDDSITPLEILPQEVDYGTGQLYGESTTWTFNSENITNLPIYSIRFDAASLKRFLLYNEAGNDFLLINYSEEGEEK